MDWTEIRKRYPGDREAVPERPWWRRVPGEAWVRTDGLRLLWPHEASVLREYETKYGRVLDERGLLRADANPETYDDAAARLDREHPLPAPLPACGQVWLRPEGECLIVFTRVNADGDYEVTYGRADGFNSTLSNPDYWPHGAVLVAGPNSPWQDTRS